MREFQSQLNKILSIIIPLCVFFRNTTGNGGGCNESTLQTGEAHVEVGMNHL